MNGNGTVSLNGALTMKVLRKGSMSQVPFGKLSLWEMLWHGLPRPGLSREVFVWRLWNIPNFLRGYWKLSVARLFKIGHFYGQVSLVLIKANGQVIDYGLASLRVVTDVGVAFIVDAFQNIVELEIMKFHGYGTGGTAESAAQTALVTELTTQYATDNVRPTGTTIEGATANIYRTVGTLSPDATVAITEHGVFSQAATGGGVMIDRSLFSVVNLVSGDSLQSTYDLTFTSGS